MFLYLDRTEAARGEETGAAIPVACDIIAWSKRRNGKTAGVESQALPGANKVPWPRLGFQFMGSEEGSVLICCCPVQPEVLILVGLPHKVCFMNIWAGPGWIYPQLYSSWPQSCTRGLLLKFIPPTRKTRICFSLLIQLFSVSIITCEHTHISLTSALLLTGISSCLSNCPDASHLCLTGSAPSLCI